MQQFARWATKTTGSDLHSQAVFFHSTTSFFWCISHDATQPTNSVHHDMMRYTDQRQQSYKCESREDVFHKACFEGQRWTMETKFLIKNRQTFTCSFFPSAHLNQYVSFVPRPWWLVTAAMCSATMRQSTKTNVRVYFSYWSGGNVGVGHKRGKKHCSVLKKCRDWLSWSWFRLLRCEVKKGKLQAHFYLICLK